MKGVRTSKNDLISKDGRKRILDAFGRISSYTYTPYTYTYYTYVHMYMYMYAYIQPLHFKFTPFLVSLNYRSQLSVCFIELGDMCAYKARKIMRKISYTFVLR